MLPRFSNPHFLPQTLETINRAKIYADDKEDVHSTLKVDPKAIEELNRLIKHSLPKIRYEVSSALDAGNKSQTLGPNEDIETEEEHLVLFRLVSSSQPPLPLSLLSPPPPPSKTREPGAEDTEERALLRKQRAEAAFVDGADILRESLILMASPHASKETIHMQAIVPDTEPCMMIVRTLQNPRKTRPPLPSSQFSHFPYVLDKSKMLIQPASSKIPECPTIDAELVPSEAPPRNSRRRRRRGVLAKKERPPPQFWRPDPTLKGKCRGYAYGYPSNLSLAESYANGGGNRPWRYRRDTMKKGTYLDSSTATQVTYGYSPNQR